nr:sugar phosphate nucleotidyltransferase [Pseudoflavonifractor sp. BIOML-A6]
MAGGEGTRLRPLSLGRPKPMTPLFDKPVMEHIITLLKSHGITDICVTLQYMPRAVTDYFGDGAELGVRLTYFVEEEPLGTAGSVKNCMSHLGEEDFLVISGDAVCDLDLSAAMGFHAARRSAATLVLYHHPTPLEYGLVLTDEEGRIRRFIEKPSWGQVLTNMVNTGIYLLTPRAMELVPEGRPFDFGKDLFPLLLERGEAMFGCAVDGYWCDMGDGPAYLRCVADALSGKVKLDLGAPRVASGVWAESPIPPTVEIVPPCYIGRGVTLGDGSLIGPDAAIGAGSCVGRRALVQNSALHAARVGDRATLYGAILCRDSSAGAGSVLNEGTALGEEAVLGRDAILMEGVKVWPNRAVEVGARLTASLTEGGLKGPLKFGDGGVIRGIIGEDLTPEALLLLGNALGTEGRVGLGHCGGEGAGMLAQAALRGMAAAGCRVYSHDGPCAASAAWLAGSYALPASLFVEQDGERAYLHLFDRRGLPLGRARERKLEGAMLRGEMHRVPARQVGQLERVGGVQAAYADDARHRARLNAGPMRPLTVCVPGESGGDDALAEALERLGCDVKRSFAPAVPAFRALHGGFQLMAWDEEGRELEPERMLTLVSLVEFQNGDGRVAVPAGAPVSIDLLAHGHGGVVLRLGRDGKEADERYENMPWLRDAVFAACRICVRMGATGEALRTLDGKAPLFNLRRTEVPLAASRGDVMQAIAREVPGAESAGEGLRISSGDGWVYIAPLTRRPALRVVGESFDAETARELCGAVAEKARELDGRMKKEI